jgi:hypothetical protein
MSEQNPNPTRNLTISSYVITGGCAACQNRVKFCFAVLRAAAMPPCRCWPWRASAGRRTGGSPRRRTCRSCSKWAPYRRPRTHAAPAVRRAAVQSVAVTPHPSRPWSHTTYLAPARHLTHHLLPHPPSGPAPCISGAASQPLVCPNARLHQCKARFDGGTLFYAFISGICATLYATNEAQYGPSLRLDIW